MAVPNSRQSLIDYALRQLGAPVVRIDVEESQLEDRIDDAIQLFQMYHFDGTKRQYVSHVLTQENIDNRYIPVPDTIQYIKRILPIRSRAGASSSFFDIRYQIHLNDLFDLAYAGTIAHYYQTKQYIELLERVIHGNDEFEFSRLEDRLYFPSLRWQDMEPGFFIMIEAHIIVDPTAHSEFYSDRWLKRYVTALIKRQWGYNLKKWEGVQLPGGAVLNGQALFTEADTEVKELEQELRSEFEAPLGFLVG